MKSYQFYINRDIIMTVEDVYEVQANSPEEARAIFIEAFENEDEGQYFIERDSYEELEDYGVNGVYDENDVQIS